MMTSTQLEWLLMDPTDSMSTQEMFTMNDDPTEMYNQYNNTSEIDSWLYEISNCSSTEENYNHNMYNPISTSCTNIYDTTDAYFDSLSSDQHDSTNSIESSATTYQTEETAASYYNSFSSTLSNSEYSLENCDTNYQESLTSSAIVVEDSTIHQSGDEGKENMRYPYRNRVTGSDDQVRIRKKCKYICQNLGCGKVFIRISHLMYHMRTHNGEKPFACNWILCDKEFTRHDELLRHLRTHTGEKKYSCSICNKKFMRSDHLKKHSNVHKKKKNSNKIFGKHLKPLRLSMDLNSLTTNNNIVYIENNTCSMGSSMVGVVVQEPVNPGPNLDQIIPTIQFYSEPTNIFSLENC